MVIFRRFDPLVRSRELMEKALSSKFVRKPYEEANSIPSVGQGPWKIKFAKDLRFLSNMKNLNSLGICDFPERAIYIKSSSSNDSVLSLFVFVLTNAIHWPKFFELQKRL